MWIYEMAVFSNRVETCPVYGIEIFCFSLHQNVVVANLWNWNSSQGSTRSAFADQAKVGI